MPTTQSFLPIREIHEDVVILKDGSWRQILMASSINFALMSKEEQEAVIYQFQNFLNSLDFYIQFLVQSRRLNLDKYLKELDELITKEENELLKMQGREYREFIKSLSEMSNLMTKTFYVVVPFHPGVTKKTLSKKDFSHLKYQLDQRVAYVRAGLRRCGIFTVILKSPEIVELLWSTHHPAKFERGEIPPFPSIE